MIIISSALYGANDYYNLSSNTRPIEQFKAGPGVVISTKPYIGMDTQYYVVPFIFYQYDKITFAGTNLGYNLLQESNYAVNIIAKWRFDGYDADDSSALAGMEDREFSVDAGGDLSVFGDWGTIKTSFVLDVTGRHDGFEAGLSYSKRLHYDPLILSPLVGFNWRSDKLNNYYYGVRTSEAQAGRNAYPAGESLNWFGGCELNYELGENWSLYGRGVYEHLGSEITNSPIVDEDHVVKFIAGAIYTF